MATTTNLGKKFLVAICSSQDIQGYLKFGPIEHLFRHSEATWFQAVHQHVAAHGVLPQVETLETLVAETLPPVKEPSTFYYESMQDRYLESVMRSAALEADKLLQSDQKDVKAAFEHMTDELMRAAIQRKGAGLLDYRESYDLVWETYKAQELNPDAFGIPFGWPTLDTMSGGIQGGDLWSLCGRPGSGKTYLLLHAARHAWRMGWRVLVVTMEMGVLQIVQRLVALDAKLPVSALKQQFNQALTEKQRHTLRAHLEALKAAQNPMWIIHGTGSTGHDVRSWAAQLNPDVIMVDGAYLLKHPDTRLGRYQRVAENTDVLKEAAGALDVGIMATWQLNREAEKKSAKGQEVGLSDIGYSDAIGQISTGVLMMNDEDSAETLTQRRVELAKGREGEEGEFRVGWNFETMELGELTASTADLETE